MKRHQARTNRGLTLVEIMVAVFLLSMLTLAVVGSTTFQTSMAHLNNNRMIAKNIAQGFIERMRADEFREVGPVGYGDGIYENRIPGAPGWPDVFIDENRNITCEVYFHFKGYGQATGGSTTTLVDGTSGTRDPDGVRPGVEDGTVGWRTDEWAGSILCILMGPGAAQWVEIESNTADTLTFAEPLAFPVGPSSVYMINNGKTVNVITRWEYRGQEYTQQMQGIVANYQGAADRGFAGCCLR